MYLYLMIMSVLPACMHMYMWYLQRIKDSAISRGTGVTDDCELLRGCWEMNLDPLQNHQVLLTTEPCPQLRHKVS